MKLPRPRKSEFMYNMIMIYIAMDTHLFKKIPIELIKKLDSEEQMSLLATLIENGTYE